MNSYCIRDENGKHSLRKGTLSENINGLVYFNSDWNKAKKYDSIPIYRKGLGKLELLRFVGYRTKKLIDTPFKCQEVFENGDAENYQAN